MESRVKSGRLSGARNQGAVAWLSLLVGLGALAAQPGERFATRLTRFAADAVDAPKLRGDGRVELSVDGGVATLHGTFSGLVSPATRARLFEGAAAGVPGRPVADLTVTRERSGEISGQITLDAARLQALRTARLYVQLDSAQAPDGTLWGWLMVDHPFPGANVPEKQDWFAGGLK